MVGPPLGPPAGLSRAVRVQTCMHAAEAYVAMDVRPINRDEPTWRTQMHHRHRCWLLLHDDSLPRKPVSLHDATESECKKAPTQGRKEKACLLGQEARTSHLRRDAGQEVD